MIVEAPGRDARKIDITLSERERKEIEVAPGDVARTPATDASRSDVEPRASSSSPLRTVGIALAGTGVVAVGVGTVFGLVALSKNSGSDADGRCIDDACNGDGLALREDARSAGNISTAFFIGGVVCLAAGAILYFTAPKSSSSARSRPHEGGLVFGGTF